MSKATYERQIVSGNDYRVERIANRDARSHVENMDYFKGSNLYSDWTINSKGLEVYVVYSYGDHFPMFCYESGHWYENSDKYSVSTSKQQSQCRPRGVELTLMTKGAMRRISETGIAGLAAMGEIR